MSFIEFGNRRPVTTLMLVCAVTIFALVGIRRIPVELYPNYEFGEISIISHLRGGVPASEVEKYVTKPMEEIFSEVNGLKEIISASREAESVIVLKFYPKTNLDFAILEIREKLATIRHKLPREMERPIIAKYQQFDIPILILTLSSDKYKAEYLREVAEDNIKERFMRVSGVANIEVGGGRERKILIDIDNSKLVGFNLPILSVIEKINLSNISVSAGEINKFNERYIVRATGEYNNLEEIKNTAVGITEKGSAIRLGEIADVRDSYYEPSSFARMNLRSVVSMYIQKETTANTLSVEREIIKEIEKLRKIYSNEILFTVVKNDAEYIRNSIRSLGISLVYSVILVCLVLVVFLKSLKSILIIILIVPISIFFTIVLMYFSKLTLNIMTLSSLGLGVGMLVDNSIIILENIAFYSKKEKDKQKAVFLATKELFLPILASTLTTIIVFLPLVFLEPEVKRLYVPFGLTITFSLVSSLVGSIIFIPPLVLKVFKNLDLEKPLWEIKLINSFNSVLELAFKNSLKIIILVSFFFFLTYMIFKSRDSEFMEATDINTFRIGVQFPPATRIDYSNEIVKKIESQLMSYEQVERVTSKVEKLHTFIEVKVKRELEKVMDNFRKEFDKFLPAFLYYQPSQSLASKEVFVDLYGYDYSILKQMAFMSSGRLSQIKNLSDVKIRMREDEPEIIVNIERDKLSLLGLTSLYFANTLHGQLRGLVATYYRALGKEIETICRLIPGTVKSQKDLETLRFVSPYNDIISVAQVSKVDKVDTQQEIWHKNKKRYIQVSGNRRNVGLSKAVSIINEELKRLKFPKDYFYKFSGEYEDLVKNTKQFILALLLTIILIYMTLASMFESYKQPLIIMVSIPLGLIGVSFFLLIFKRPISIGVWIGLMMLGGIVVNSAIVIVEKINIFRRKYSLDLKSSIFGATDTYLLEVLMTSLTTILGVLPLILNFDESSVMWRTLGFTIFGGMLFSTFLVLILVPLLYYYLEIISVKKINIKGEIISFKNTMSILYERIVFFIKRNILKFIR